MSFVKAKKSQSKLRMAISGVSGSGKTYTALSIASGLGEKIALIDSENYSASKYADIFDFDVNDISENTHPEEYVNAIKEAESAGYDVLIIDSITHAWKNTLEIVDTLTEASRTKNSYVQWNKGTKIWNSLISAINKSKIHVIVTMRSKAEYLQTENNGKKSIQKVGTAPEARDGTEYEFDIQMEMDINHYGVISKTRCVNLDGFMQKNPGKEVGELISSWLDDGITQEQLEEERKKSIFLKWIEGRDFEGMPFEEYLNKNGLFGRLPEDWSFEEIEKFMESFKVWKSEKK